MTNYVYSSGENCHELAMDTLKERCGAARRYLSKNHWKRAAKVQKIFYSALFLWGLAVVVALLVG